MAKIEQRGSLTLHHDAGDDRNPETYTVVHLDRPGVSGSLEVARDFFELADRNGQTVRLNGSQVKTVKLWSDKYL